MGDVFIVGCLFLGAGLSVKLSYKSLEQIATITWNTNQLHINKRLGLGDCSRDWSTCSVRRNLSFCPLSTAKSSSILFKKNV